MPRFSSLFTPIRQSLLERDDGRDPFDPFGPLDEVRRKRRPVSLPLTAPVGPTNLPKTQNLPDDVGRVEGALGRAGILGGKRQRPVFDTRLQTGVRDFQRQKGLRVDGLLNPGGPTIKALGRVLARPPLKGLSGAAVSANARLVRHLMTTTADGMVPGLMATDFGLGEAGRAKTADFLSQLFGRDPTRARSLRAKARGLMETDEKSLLDKLILQARLADEDDDPTPDDPGQDDPDEDEEPDDPEEPEKPKPDKEKCKRLHEALKEAEADLRGAESLHDGAQKAVNEKTDEVDRKQAAYEEALIAFAIENGIVLIFKTRLPPGVQLPSDVLRAKEAYEIASRELEVLIEELHRAEDKLGQARERVAELNEEIEAAGCNT